jgi:hypothetical protein
VRVRTGDSLKMHIRFRLLDTTCLNELRVRNHMRTAWKLKIEEEKIVETLITHKILGKTFGEKFC